MKKLKIIIIGLIILVAIIIISLIVISKINPEHFQNNEESREEKFDESDIVFESSAFEYEKYNSNYYGISNVINDFIQYSNMIYNESYNNNSNVDLQIQKSDKELYAERLLSILSENYKNKYNIDKNTLKNFVTQFNNETYQINKMYSSLRDNGVKIYFVYGKLTSSKKDYNFMIAVDVKTNAYEVYLNNYVNDMKFVESQINKLKIENENVELNSFNEFRTRDISDEEMAGNYLKNYKQKLQSNLEEAYKMLDDEYRKARFESFDKFQEYYKMQTKELITSSLTKYKVVSNDDYIDYICVDNYDNCFTFRATAVMQYTVLLDEYTIETNEFKDKYKSASNAQKVYTNIEKFVKMINTKDYEKAYSVLDEDYRNINFNNLDIFAEYVKNNYYKYNIVKSFGDASLSEDGEYYVCTAYLKDAQNSQSDSIEVNFIVHLEDLTKFTIAILD